MKSGIRKSAIAGTWYPGSSRVLAAEIEKYFRNVPKSPPRGYVVSLIAPHAGYVYSGQVAAYAYKEVRGQAYDSVVIIGPSHRAYFPGCSVCSRGGFETPLGIVPVDSATAGRIIAAGLTISDTPDVHEQEHSIEIQLPFLQVALGTFQFVPILMGRQDRKTCEDLAEALVGAVVGRNILIVASSDLSHYHPYDEAVRMDSGILKCIEEIRPDDLLKDMERGLSEACGGGPVAAAMKAAKKLGADRAAVLRYANSGDVTGDRSSVVGYAAAMIYKRWSNSGDR
ncbi:MAG: AmmeMemoRadiSam system protein B [Syntrophales bacterium]